MQAVLAQSVERWTSYPTVKGSTVPCVEYILLMLEYMFLEIIFNLEAWFLGTWKVHTGPEKYTCTNYTNIGTPDYLCP